MAAGDKAILCLPLQQATRQRLAVQLVDDADAQHEIQT